MTFVHWPFAMSYGWHGWGHAACDGAACDAPRQAADDALKRISGVCLPPARRSADKGFAMDLLKQPWAYLREMPLPTSLTGVCQMGRCSDAAVKMGVVFRGPVRMWKYQNSRDMHPYIIRSVIRVIHILYLIDLSFRTIALIARNLKSLLEVF